MRFNRLSALAAGLCLAAVTAAAPAWAAGASPASPDSPDPYALAAPAAGAPLLAAPREAAVEGSGTCGDNLTWTVTRENGESTLTITGEGAMKDYANTGEEKAPWPEYIKHLVLPDGLTSIGNWAFQGCDELTSAVIPESVKTIGEYAFSGCFKLETTIPQGVEAIGANAFGDCRALASVTVPGTVQTIGFGAFSGCGALETLTVSEGVEAIGSYAFQGCKNLSSVSIPGTVKTIGEKAFEGCSAIQTFTVAPGNGIYSFQNGLLLGGGGKELLVCLIQPDGALTVPDGVETVKRDAFLLCTSLTSVTFPASLTAIESRAFAGCSNLASAAIPSSGLRTIGMYAFQDCRRLDSVTLPASLEEIGPEAFQNCPLSGLASDSPRFPFENGFLLNQDRTELILCVPAGPFPAVPEGVEVIKDSAFAGRSGLSGVVFPDSLRAIGMYAFSECPDLSGTLVLPEGVESIADNAFADCPSLAAAVLPASLTHIGYDAFSGCGNLQTAVYGGTEADLAGICPDSSVSMAGLGPKTFYYGGDRPETPLSYAAAVLNGGTGASAGGNYESGASVALAAGAREHYTFDRWTVTGAALTQDQLKANPLTFTMPAGPVTAAANWKLNSHAVAVVNGGAGASGAGPHDYGTSVTLNAGTKAGHTFTGWTVTGVALTEAQRKANPLTFLMPDGPVTAAANWALPSADSVSQTGSTVKLTFPGAAPADGAKVLAALDGAAALSGTYDATGSQVTFQKPLEKGRKLLFLDPGTLVPLAMPAILE